MAGADGNRTSPPMHWARAFASAEATGDTRDLDDGGRRVLVERLLRAIDEGRRTATYKLALVSGLLDAVAERQGDAAIPARLIAERVVALYFPQARDYVDIAATTEPIRQITMKSSPAIAAVAQLRSSVPAAARSLSAARAANPSGWARSADVVEDLTRWRLRNELRRSELAELSAATRVGIVTRSHLVADPKRLRLPARRHLRCGCAAGTSCCSTRRFTPRHDQLIGAGSQKVRTWPIARSM